MSAKFSWPEYCFVFNAFVFYCVKYRILFTVETEHSTSLRNHNYRFNFSFITLSKKVESLPKLNRIPKANNGNEHLKRSMTFT